ncbi:MAG: metallophosphoesterase [Atopobiaceae bacterium]|nr:metallophosphoesterase [Atopobiaceae bacterium]
MIYLTGGFHGGTFAEKLEEYNTPELYSTSREDFLIIVGDFGLPWPGEDFSDLNCAWLEKRPWTTLFIDGNHENYPVLYSLEEESFYGGKASRLPDYPHLIHLKRGEVYDLPNGLDTVRIFCMGGAESVVDRRYRCEGIDWWPEELPSEEELAHGEASLNRAEWLVDYVISHCSSTRLQAQAIWPSVAFATAQPNRLTNWLDALEDKLTFDYWYMGHYHKDIGLDEKHAVIFDAVIPLGEQLSLDSDRRW